MCFTYNFPSVRMRRAEPCGRHPRLPFATPPCTPITRNAGPAHAAGAPARHPLGIALARWSECPTRRRFRSPIAAEVGRSRPVARRVSCPLATCRAIRRPLVLSPAHYRTDTQLDRAGERRGTKRGGTTSMASSSGDSGTFKLRHRKARNPKSGEPVAVPARAVATFQPSKDLQDPGQRGPGGWVSPSRPLATLLRRNRRTGPPRNLLCMSHFVAPPGARSPTTGRFRLPPAPRPGHRSRHRPARHRRRPPRTGPPRRPAGRVTGHRTHRSRRRCRPAAIDTSASPPPALPPHRPSTLGQARARRAPRHEAPPAGASGLSTACMGW